MYVRYEEKAFHSKLKSETKRRPFSLFDVKVLESKEKPRAEFALASLCFFAFAMLFPSCLSREVTFGSPTSVPV